MRDPGFVVVAVAFAVYAMTKAVRNARRAHI